MFLKSLTLKGFKSFADTTTLDFEPGVTVVVGPNGSGKSNVVDAVAWVLGAQGPRTVRSAKMEDVIFAGTPKRAALGRAEVTLTIDNSAGLLPIGFSEVTITRTLFRSGDSEYAINGVPCRLLDVQDLLSDSGVGRQQHVIVSQGNLDAVLNARPEERRLIIEEAAGILKYRKRKERSERRLESTEASLTRLQDLLREVRRQLRPLERQAEAARRHGDLVDELSAVRRHLAGRELAAIEARLSGAGRTRGELERAEQEVRSLLARQDAGIAAIEAELDTARAGEDRVDLADILTRAESVRARGRGMAAVLAERGRSVARERAVAVDQDVVSSLEAEAADLTAQLAAADSEDRALEPRGAELAHDEAALAAESRALDDAFGPTDVPTPVRALAEARSELAALRSVTERGQAELGRLAAHGEAVGGRVSRLRTEVERQRAVVTECDGRGIELDDAVARAGAELEAATTAEAASAEARRRADAEHQRWSARYEALAQALDEARARAGAERLATVSGVVGTLLELVEIDHGWEIAFETAAGEALAAVLVEDEGAGRRALEELRRVGASGAVAALGVLGSAAGSGDDPEAALPGASALRPHVRAQLPAVSRFLDRLLTSTVVVEGEWSSAVDAALARPDLTVVTFAGDRCSGGLWRTGSGGAGATGGSLDEARAREADTLALAAARATEWTAAAASLTAARVRRDDAVRAVESNRSRRLAAADGLRHSEAQLAESSAELQTATVQQRELTERLAGETGRLGELEASLPDLERGADEEGARAERGQLARNQLADRVRAVAAKRREFEVRIAGLEERRVVLRRRRAEVDERLARHAAEREEAGRRREAIESRGRAVSRLAAGLAERNAGLDAAVDCLRRARRDEADATRSRSERLDRLRRERAEAEKELAGLRERSGRIDVDEAEGRVRLEALTDTVRRDLDCEPGDTRDAPCPALPPGTTAEHRGRELERELRLMGPVNPLALEEYEALRERHEFLEAQLEDVRSARRELNKVIRAIDAEIVDVFRAAWADVAENFEQLFATLFPGGQGQLRLTDPDHLLDTGIEVEARPSGKNVRRLSLLSGGERSLTALAYLFAVFRSRPSPFYLMDEVEAALDDVNLHRFLELVHEFRDEAQLVVVTHQKRTMEAADCLYGVTMAPGGSSRVVSERVTAQL